MSETLDQIDLALLRALQRDATLTVDALADAVHLSRNACWRRVRALEARGVIRGRVALVDAHAVGLPLTALVAIRAGAHDPDWAARFRRAVAGLDEVVSAWRVSGETDYMLRVRLADMRAYDRFYQRLIARIELADISAAFVMEDLKDTTALPL